MLKRPLAYEPVEEPNLKQPRRFTDNGAGGVTEYVSKARDNGVGTDGENMDNLKRLKGSHLQEESESKFVLTPIIEREAVYLSSSDEDTPPLTSSGSDEENGLNDDTFMLDKKPNTKKLNHNGSYNEKHTTIYYQKSDATESQTSGFSKTQDLNSNGFEFQYKSDEKIGQTIKPNKDSTMSLPVIGKLHDSLLYTDSQSATLAPWETPVPRAVSEDSLYSVPKTKLSQHDEESNIQSPIFENQKDSTPQQPTEWDERYDDSSDSDIEIVEVRPVPPKVSPQMLNQLIDRYRYQEILDKSSKEHLRALKREIQAMKKALEKRSER